VENIIIYFGSLVIGVFLGFAVSKLVTMILFKIIGVDAVASLHFSSKALVQTLIVFAVIYLFIMLMNFMFIKRQTILSLFRVISSTEGKLKKMSMFGNLVGILGIVLIATGYYVSSKLFSGDTMTTEGLFVA